MKKLVNNAYQHVGAAPGTLTYKGQADVGTVKLTVWKQGQSDGLTLTTLEELKVQDAKFQWINVEGLQDIELLKTLGDKFNIHSLFLEDALSPAQRPKVETIGDCTLVSVKALSVGERQTIKSQTVTFILVGQALFSFSDLRAEAWLAPIAMRLANTQGALRKRGCYYFLYALIDVLVDQYFQVLESVGDQIQALDESLYNAYDANQLDALYQLKKQILYLNKQISPVPDFIRKMPSHMTEKAWLEVKIYFDDLLDHSLQAQDATKTYLEALNNLFDLYFSLVNLKMNRTIQALTVITVVFLPLNLIAGVYGMNFIMMPGIGNPHSFWWVVGGMVWLSGGILWILKRKGWF